MPLVRVIRDLWKLLTFPFRILPRWANLLIVMGLGIYYRSYLIILGTIFVFHPVPIPPLFMPEPESVAEARLQDLRHFRHVGLNERSFTEETRTAFDTAVAALTAQVESLSDAEFLLGLARAQATIDNGHSNTSATQMVAGFPRLPIRSAWFEQELHILRVLPGFEDLLGAQITHINGVTAAEAAHEFRSAFGGNDQNFSGINPLFLETPAMLVATDLSESQTDIQLRLVLSNGVTTTRVLSAVAPADSARRIHPGYLQLPWKVENANWVALTPQTREAAVPLYLQNPDLDYWMTVIGDTGVVYVSFRSNLDDPDAGETLAAFVDRAEEEIREISPRTIIVDQRFNSGGDFTLTANFMTALVDVTREGRIYLLTSGQTFSAGIVNLAFAEQAAPERVFIVGEPVGDRLQFWAEGWGYNLPNSNFRARFSTGFYDLQNGCEGLFRCHWGSLHLMPVLVDSLDVDIIAPMSFDDYAAGRDPALRSISWGETARQWDREDWDTLARP